jgi:hypothetical protein
MGVESRVIWERGGLKVTKRDMDEYLEGRDWMCGYFVLGLGCDERILRAVFHIGRTVSLEAVVTKCVSSLKETLDGLKGEWIERRYSCGDYLEAKLGMIHISVIPTPHRSGEYVQSFRVMPTYPNNCGFKLNRDYGAFYVDTRDYWSLLVAVDAMMFDVVKVVSSLLDRQTVVHP